MLSAIGVLAIAKGSQLSAQSNQQPGIQVGASNTPVKPNGLDSVVGYQASNGEILGIPVRLPPSVLQSVSAVVPGRQRWPHDSTESSDTPPFDRYRGSIRRHVAFVADLNGDCNSAGILIGYARGSVYAVGVQTAAGRLTSTLFHSHTAEDAINAYSNHKLLRVLSGVGADRKIIDSPYEKLPRRFVRYQPSRCEI